MSNKRKKLTQDDFIKRATEVHNNKYSYENVIYINTKEKVSITCPEHGDFEQSPGHHLNGFGCAKCSGKHNYTTEEYISKVSSIHNNKYEYTKTIYVRKHDKVVVTCKVHGDFAIQAGAHLRGKGCSKCHHESFITPVEEFYKKACNVHNNLYTYDLTTYSKATSPVKIICSEHGEFWQQANAHLSGSNCPICANIARNALYMDKPTILYYLKINGGQAYKIGITTKSIQERFSSTELQCIEVLATKYYTTGKEAYEAEQQVLVSYNEYKYTGEPLLKAGNSELFTKDILELDTAQFVL